jgi:hypothetical protein
MGTTLDRINGEALSVPGLRFRSHRQPGNPKRFAIVGYNERGAIELWSEPNNGRVQAITGEPSMGGIETHSPRQLYDFSPEPTREDCLILGGPCWADGSSLAYRDRVLPLLAVGDSAAILQLIADWHASHFPTT